MTLTDERITAERLEELLADDSIDMAHRALWLLLWEGDLRVLDLLSLEIQDVDLRARRVTGVCGRAVPEGEGDISERAAGLLREVVGDRESGPLFATGNRALGWEQVMLTAGEQGHAVHEFRAGGRLHRRGEPAADPE
ncbi:site-specific integrase [Streptomyces fenghuangensis]|uniref:Site-specific integrase n=1 Tax=Streptomyces chitinivorans TaxID=1257027 RepID=A0ABW7HTE3_9ACTN|nr:MULTISPECIES: site-specific integrase [Streptomyces]MCG3041350.1 site-specific integrase [Streptomyces sp. ICN903]MDH2411631.1 site-specific integrase [Streptomyces chitinivorans]